MNKEGSTFHAPDSEGKDIAAYDYSFNLESERSASRVARLVGKNKAVLEVGCGPGSQSRVFTEQLGCDVVGIEIDPGRAARARAYCRHVHLANLETADLSSLLKDETFDVIVCADVLEHLRTPDKLLIALKAFLKPDGYLIASIPNITHASVVYEMIYGRFEYRNEGLLDATHLRYFSCTSAVSLIEDAGYWITDFQKVSSLPQHTEFRTNPITAQEKQLLAAILSNNPYATTYQFVIKAHPLRDSYPKESNVFTMREEIRQLRHRISSYEEEVRRLNSTLNWHSKPFIARLMAKLNLLSNKK